MISIKQYKLIVSFYKSIALNQILIGKSKLNLLLFIVRLNLF